MDEFNESIVEDVQLRLDERIMENKYLISLYKSKIKERESKIMKVKDKEYVRALELLIIDREEDLKVSIKNKFELYSRFG